MKIAVWSPLPPARSEVAEHTAELIPALAEHHDVVAVVEDASAVDTEVIPGIPVVDARSALSADVDVYQIGVGPTHVFAYRAALARPGVTILHQWILHDLVRHEAEERGDPSGYLREMRYSHGPAGTLVGRQVERGLVGTMLPQRFATNDRLMESSLGVVTLTRDSGARLRRRHPGTPHLHLPQPLADPAGPPLTRAEARRALGLPIDALLVTAPGHATASSELEALISAAGRLRGERPSLRLVIAGEIDPEVPWKAWASQARLGDALVATGPLSAEDLQRHLIAADVVSVLRFPSRGEMPRVLVHALGVGRPALVTAGTPAAEEMPEGVVVPVDPGPRERGELVGLLRRLLASEELRNAIGRAAREHALAHHGLSTVAARLSEFLVEVQGQRARLLSRVEAHRSQGGTLAEHLAEEVRWAARDLGLAGLDLDIARRLEPIATPRRPPGGER